ncbi:MAG TPA: hypothetical protein VFY24_01795 [Azospira sp.]|nr:hypothetical protein [Azospira sp.]
MSKRWPFLLLALAAAGLSPTPAPAASPQCVPERLPAGARALGPWIDGGNWLSPGALRAGLRAPEVFLARQRVAADPSPLPLPAAARPLDLEQLTLADPVDGARRSLAFLLDSRLYADALVVVYNGRVFAERAWHGTRSDAPALLPQAGRPLLALLGVVAVGQGKLAAERAVSRYLPALANDAGLRRLSVQRLLDGEARFDRPPAEIAGWRRAAGWPGEEPGSAAGVRDWLRQPERWDDALLELPPPTAVGAPEDDLLAWLLAESQATPLAQLFCEQLLGRLRPEQPVAWLADAAGHELGGGLVMSLRDFARVGQWLLDARANPQRGRLPAWFVEALTAPAGKGDGATALAGLPRGSELRYGFVRLGGPGTRVAIVGAHGTSLYVDFDRRLVVALRAAHPEARSPLQLALLDRLWERLSAAVPAPGRR